MNEHLPEEQRPPFILFVAGDSPNSRAAMSNLQRALARLDLSLDAVRIINVFDDPEAASLAHILVTPTLVRETKSYARIVGDLSNPGQLADFLSTVVDG